MSAKRTKPPSLRSLGFKPLKRSALDEIPVCDMNHEDQTLRLPNSKRKRTKP